MNIQDIFLDPVQAPAAPVLLSNRDIRRAHKRLQLAWEHLLRVWAQRHPDDPVPFLSQVYRSAIEQRAYYAQGRESLSVINELRDKAGLAPIDAEEAWRKVTNSPPGRSKHERTPSEAIDVAFVKKGTKRDLDWTPRLFLQVAKILREFDPKITWGADWNRNWNTKDERFIDSPHFEI
ncbi:hypothetical protein GCM10027275_24800 [Rhabdobacter roseus]|uniref:M15 family metallopeptidase n=1 Tax=Rhabdobacter roseus TaxID=1655419 RepID=A0A840TWV1_9BACT|nr:M15 family metallopeptidase [Rhabdobacter roseus]MBB5284420.1 hypothetical protein [Rhabdobacter roseus]